MHTSQTSPTDSILVLQTSIPTPQQHCHARDFWKLSIAPNPKVLQNRQLVDPPQQSVPLRVHRHSYPPLILYRTPRWNFHLLHCLTGCGQWVFRDTLSTKCSASVYTWFRTVDLSRRWHVKKCFQQWPHLLTVKVSLEMLQLQCMSAHHQPWHAQSSMQWVLTGNEPSGNQYLTKTETLIYIIQEHTLRTNCMKCRMVNTTDRNKCKIYSERGDTV